MCVREQKGLERKIKQGRGVENDRVGCCFISRGLERPIGRGNL
jgi:hypothetical protein